MTIYPIMGYMLWKWRNERMLGFILKLIIYIFITAILCYILFYVTTIAWMITTGLSFLFGIGAKDDGKDNIVISLIIALGLVYFKYFIGISSSIYGIFRTIAVLSLIIGIIKKFSLRKKYKKRFLALVEKWGPISANYAMVKTEVKNTISDHLANVGPATGNEIIDNNDFSFYTEYSGYSKELREELDEFNSCSEKSGIECVDSLLDVPQLNDQVIYYLDELKNEGDIILKVVLNQTDIKTPLYTNLYESTRGEPMESETISYDDL